MKNTEWKNLGNFETEKVENSVAFFKHILEKKDGQANNQVGLNFKCQNIISRKYNGESKSSPSNLIKSYKGSAENGSDIINSNIFCQPTRSLSITEKLEIDIGPKSQMISNRKKNSTELIIQKDKYEFLSGNWQEETVSGTADNLGTGKHEENSKEEFKKKSTVFEKSKNLSPNKIPNKLENIQQMHSIFSSNEKLGQNTFIQKEVENNKQHWIGEKIILVAKESSNFGKSNILNEIKAQIDRIQEIGEIHFDKKKHVNTKNDNTDTVISQLNHFKDISENKKNIIFRNLTEEFENMEIEKDKNLNSYIQNNKNQINSIKYEVSNELITNNRKFLGNRYENRSQDFGFKQNEKKVVPQHLEIEDNEVPLKSLRNNLTRFNKFKHSFKKEPSRGTSLGKTLPKKTGDRFTIDNDSDSQNRVSSIQYCNKTKLSLWLENAVLSNSKKITNGKIEDLNKIQKFKNLMSFKSFEVCLQNNLATKYECKNNPIYLGRKCEGQKESVLKSDEVDNFIGFQNKYSYIEMQANKQSTFLENQLMKNLIFHEKGLRKLQLETADKQSEFNIALTSSLNFRESILKPVQLNPKSGFEMLKNFNDTNCFWENKLKKLQNIIDLNTFKIKNAKNLLGQCKDSFSKIQKVDSHSEKLKLREKISKLFLDLENLKNFEDSFKFEFNNEFLLNQNKILNENKCNKKVINSFFLNKKIESSISGKNNNIENTGFIKHQELELNISENKLETKNKSLLKLCSEHVNELVKKIQTKHNFTAQKNKGKDLENKNEINFKNTERKLHFNKTKEEMLKKLVIQKKLLKKVPINSEKETQNIKNLIFNLKKK